MYVFLLGTEYVGGGMGPLLSMQSCLNKQDGIHCQGSMPPMAFSVPNRNKKLEVGRKSRRRRRKSQSADQRYHKGHG